MNLFKTNPAVRMALRAVAVGVLAYLATTFRNGQGAFNLSTFAWGLGAAAVYAVVGLVTPIEPKVGVKTDVQG